MQKSNRQCRNKWVLNATEVPLFFLFTQLMIACVLFLGAHALGLLQIPLDFDPVVLKGLVPMIGLNVIGLRYVCFILLWKHTLTPSVVSATTP